MSIDLIIVRHAIAWEHDPLRWPDDASRPLTDEGAESMRKAARGAAALGLMPRQVFTSPFVRARQTAQILVADAGWPDPEPLDALSSERPVRDALTSLAEARPHGSIAIVGHEPMLSEIIRTLCGADAEMKKGAIARLEAGSLAAGGATLRALLPPKALRRARGRQSSAG